MNKQRVSPKEMLKKVIFLAVHLSVASSAVVPSLFRSSGREFPNNERNYLFPIEIVETIPDWIVESVKVVAIDDGQKDDNKRTISYMISRHHSFESSTSFILDLERNPNLDRHVTIEWDNVQKIVANNCSFYTGSVRHWGQSKSMAAITICTGLVSTHCLRSS